MNYQRIHDQIIEHARQNPPEGRHEVHHILPRSMGGTDDDWNLIALSYRQHYIIHWLLIKIHPANPRLWYAFHMMNHQSSYSKRPQDQVEKRLRSNTYAINKARMAQLTSEQFKGIAKSEQHKEKMKYAAIARWQRDGEKEKQSLRSMGNDYGKANKGQVATQERRDKQSASMKKYYETHPSMRLGLKNSPEAIIKMKETKKLNPRVWTDQEKIERSVAMRAANRKQTDHQKKSVTDANSATWEITTPSGEVLVIKNLRQYCIEHRLSAGNLVTYGKTKGYHVRKLADSPAHSVV